LYCILQISTRIIEFNNRGKKEICEVCFSKKRKSSKCIFQREQMEIKISLQLSLRAFRIALDLTAILVRGAPSERIIITHIFLMENG
jgi:hypothetical protein